jgi:hypothetical protein
LCREILQVEAHRAVGDEAEYETGDRVAVLDFE